MVVSMVDGALFGVPHIMYIGITASETEEAAEIGLKVEDSILSDEILGKIVETMEKSL